MKKKWIRGLAAAAVSLFAAFGIPEAVQAAEPKTALEGIYVENISVGGMTEEEITQAVNAKVEELKNSAIQLNAGNQSIQVTAGDLGLTYTNTDIACQALFAGQRGNVLERFRVQRHLEETGPEVLELQFSVDAEAVRSVIENQAAAMNTEAVDASLTLEDGSFVVHEGQDGYVINADASVEKFVNYMSEEWHGGNGGVVLVTDVDEAQGDTEQLALVHDTLGSSSTDYSSSNSNRKQNVRRGAELINGTVLYPGEEFSVEEAVVPFDEENGYAPAASYEMGNVVETYGGGICQVSTTLYLAVLRAELEVTERSNHSMIVNYVKPSMDAAIAEGYKDFRFVNNTDAPIYIMGYADGSEIGFIIYGHETRDPNRTVTYESETLTTTESTTELVEDSSASYGSVTQKSSGHTGYTARLWKVVTVNGEETREQVNSSTYNMTPDTYAVGTNTDDSAALSAMRSAIESNDLSKVDAAASAYPGGQSPQTTPQSTAAPTQTAGSGEDTSDDSGETGNTDANSGNSTNNAGSTGGTDSTGTQGGSDASSQGSGASGGDGSQGTSEQTTSGQDSSTSGEGSGT
ncbi:MAG: VanW family protein [Lacrimispora saccharolytica]